MPANKTDFSTLLHDIKYLQTSGRPEHQSYWDDMAIRDSDSDIAGYATTVGLNLREIMGLEFNGPISGKSAAETRRIGDQLLYYVKHDPHYSRLFQRYNVDPDDY